MEGNNQATSLEVLPDHILLVIFNYLDTLSLARVSRVCCRWYNISCDQSLTKRIDLRLRPLNLNYLRNVCHRKLTPQTTEVHIRGASHVNKVMDRLSVAYFELLASKGPNLTTLSLEHFDLRDIPLTVLPSDLETLSLYESMLSMGWFDSLKYENLLTNVRVLDLRCCSKISNSDLESLAYLQNVTKLNLSNCFRISARGITSITTNLKRLKDIDFSCCPGVNNVVLYYLSNLPLEYLKLRFCHLITDHGINQLFLHNIGKTLKTLDIYSCHEVSNVSLETIANGTSCLQKLDIGACNKLSPGAVEELKSHLIHCDINFEILPVFEECFKKSNEQFCNGMSR